MLEKVITFVRSIRIRKECDEYIGSHFPNKTEFMRNAIEFMADSATKRVYQPMGYVWYNQINTHGCVRFYWGYYLKRQFILVINVHGKAFTNDREDYISLINEQLGIQPNEEVDYYYQYDVNNYTHKDDSVMVWDDGNFSVLTFGGKDCPEEQQIKSEYLVEMRRLMDIHETHFILSRKAFIYERLYGAVVQWDETLPFPDRCKSFTYKGKE